jgi:hypothetical protein
MKALAKACLNLLINKWEINYLEEEGGSNQSELPDFNNLVRTEIRHLYPELPVHCLRDT